MQNNTSQIEIVAAYYTSIAQVARRPVIMRSQNYRPLAGYTGSRRPSMKQLLGI